MSALSWPALFQRLRPLLDLKTSEPNADGWVLARCIHPERHEHGDRDFSLRINVQGGGAICMSRRCVSGNLNDVAAQLGISIFDEDAPRSRPTMASRMSPGDPTVAPKSRIPTLTEFAEARMLPEDYLRACGVAPTKDGWTLDMDDPEAAGFRRIKKLPGFKPKYAWDRAGVKARDLVYGLTSLDPAAQEVFIAAGEPDQLVLRYAGTPVVSFLAGEGAAPSSRAVQKIIERAPNLKTALVAYDRDAAGVAGALRVADTLLTAGLAVDVLRLPRDLPEKGDISDLWVRLNGDKRAFNDVLDGLVREGKHLEPVGPKVEVVMDGNDFGCRVTIPSAAGTVAYDFGSFQRIGRRLEAEMTVRVAMPGVSKEPFSTSAGLDSLSGRNDIRLQLDHLFGADLAWVQSLNTAFSKAKAAFLAADPSVDLAYIEDLTTTYRVAGFLPESEASVLYGDGSTSKTYQAITLGLCVALGRPFLGMEVVKGRVMYIDAETNQGRLRSRASRILKGWGLGWQTDLLYYWPSHGRSLADMTEAIRAKVIRDKIDVLILDSAGMLCGDEPERAATATRFYGCLGRIGKTSLIVAHVSKAEADNSRPSSSIFGSIFWANGARAAWNVRRTQNVDEDVIDVAVACRKLNDGPLPPPIGIRVAFDGDSGPVRLTRQNVADVPELARTTLPLAQRILSQLRRGAQSTDELAAALDTDVNVVKARLNELHKRSPPPVRRVRTEGRHVYWGLVTPLEDRNDAEN